PGVPRDRARAALHRGGRRGADARRPADDAAALRREPGARRPRIYRAGGARRDGAQARREEGAVRILFLLVVLAHVAFFGWFRYVAPPEAAADPQPLARQIEPQKLRIIAPGELPPVAARAAPAPVALKCHERGSFTLADATQAQAALEALQLGARLAQRRTEESAGWRVFIAPQGSRPAAQKKAAELKALAIDDYFIVQDEGPNRWALTTAVYRSEGARKARAAGL